MWTREDAESEIEWDDYLASLCSGCGQPKHETFDEANDGMYEAVDMKCHGCASRDAESRSASEAVSPPDGSRPQLGRSALDGIYYSVVERGGADER